MGLPYWKSRYFIIFISNLIRFICCLHKNIAFFISFLSFFRIHLLSFLLDLLMARWTYSRNEIISSNAPAICYLFHYYFIVAAVTRTVQPIVIMVISNVSINEIINNMFLTRLYLLGSVLVHFFFLIFASFFLWIKKKWSFGVVLRC